MAIYLDRSGQIETINVDHRRGKVNVLRINQFSFCHDRRITAHNAYCWSVVILLLVLSQQTPLKLNEPGWYVVMFYCCIVVGTFGTKPTSPVNQ